jgi:hypothetical protein
MQDMKPHFKMIPLLSAQVGQWTMSGARVDIDCYKVNTGLRLILMMIRGV